MTTEYTSQLGYDRDKFITFHTRLSHFGAGTKHINMPFS